MPNWIEGTIKIRGKSEDLKRFFTECLEPSVFFDEKPTRPLEDFVKCDFGKYNEVTISGEPHITGTRRAFIQNCDVFWEDEKSISTLAMPLKQAWSFSSRDNDLINWSNISKECNIDIRLFGFECGVEFCEEVEIIKGEITIHNVIEFDDWTWECPMPNMGG